MESVEVFKTNVKTGEQATRLVHVIHERFPHYTANFDLNDCDRILRIKSSVSIQESILIEMVRQHGFEAEVLTDEIPPFIGKEIILSAS